VSCFISTNTWLYSYVKSPIFDVAIIFQWLFGSGLFINSSQGPFLYPAVLASFDIDSFIDFRVRRLSQRASDTMLRCGVIDQTVPFASLLAALSSLLTNARLRQYSGSFSSECHKFYTEFQSTRQSLFTANAFSALTLSVGRQEGHPDWKNWLLLFWWWRFYWSFARLKRSRSSWRNRLIHHLLQQ